MSALVDDFQEVTSHRDELFNTFVSLNFYQFDLKTCNTANAKEKTLKKQVCILDSSNLNHKSKILKLTIPKKGKVNE